MTLIEKLERELVRNCRLNNWDLGFQAAVDIVKQHQSESSWILVDERLPTHSKKVLVINSVEMLVGLYDENLKGWFCGESRYAWDLIDGVTHWQPLPQLPSEVQE